MRKVTGKKFQRTEVHVDGNHYVECSFDNCSITHSGEEDVTFDRCRFKDCEWLFAGAVERSFKVVEE